MSGRRSAWAMHFQETYIHSDGLKLLLKYHSPARPRSTVLFLHGFPDDHDTWSFQLEELGKRYTVAALEMRGVGRSDGPRPGKSYSVKKILPDISRAIEFLGGPRVHLVGHDWGSMIGWCYATDPKLSANLLSYQGMSAPHPGTIRTYILDKLKTLSLGPLVRQLLKSWYVWYFQIPFLPEASIRALSPRLRSALLRKGGMDKNDPLILKSKEDFARITTGSVNLYRQLLRRTPRRPDPPRIPTQQIVPSGDLFVSPELYHGQERLLAGPNYREIHLDGPHWIHRKDPGTINAILKEFIEEHSTGAVASRSKAGLGSAPAKANSSSPKSGEGKTARKKQSARKSSKKARSRKS